jgi:hypothetical protein
MMPAPPVLNSEETDMDSMPGDLVPIDMNSDDNFSSCYNNDKGYRDNDSDSSSESEYETCEDKKAKQEHAEIKKEDVSIDKTVPKPTRGENWKLVLEEVDTDGDDNDGSGDDHVSLQSFVRS